MVKLLSVILRAYVEPKMKLMGCEYRSQESSHTDTTCPLYIYHIISKLLACDRLGLLRNPMSGMSEELQKPSVQNSYSIADSSSTYCNTVSMVAQFTSKSQYRIASGLNIPAHQSFHCGIPQTTPGWAERSLSRAHCVCTRAEAFLNVVRERLAYRRAKSIRPPSHAMGRA